MTTFMRRRLVKYRHMRNEVESHGDSAVDEVMKLRDKNAKLTRDYSTLKAFYEDQLTVVLKDVNGKQARRRDDLRKVMREHDVEVTALREEVIGLREALDDYLSIQKDTSSKLRAGSFSVPKLMNFLNQGNTNVGGNWQRLRELFEHFKAGSSVPAEWKTLINVTSADDVFADPGPYVVANEGDSGEEMKDEEGPSGGDHSHVDLTQDDSPSGASSLQSLQAYPTKFESSGAPQIRSGVLLTGRRAMKMLARRIKYLS
jgi:hypothetical protein